MAASLWQDVAFAWRSLRAAPWFVFTAVLSLSLGISANLVVLGLIDVVLFRPLPVPEPDGWVRLGATTGGDAIAPVSYSEYEALRDGAAGWRDLVLHRWNQAIVNPGDAPREEPVEVVRGYGWWEWGWR